MDERKWIKIGQTKSLPAKTKGNVTEYPVYNLAMKVE